MVTLIIIAFTCLSFICLTGSKSEKSKEIDNQNSIIYRYEITNSINTCNRHDSLPLNKRTIFVLDSITVYKSRDNSWSRIKKNINIEHYIRNDSVRIGKDNVILM